MSELEQVKAELAEVELERDELAVKLAEAEAERAAWQLLDGINWYERAKQAEQQLAELGDRSNVVAAHMAELIASVGTRPHVTNEHLSMWIDMLTPAQPEPPKILTDWERE